MSGRMRDRAMLVLLGAALGFQGVAAAAECRVAIDVGHDRQHPGAMSARGVPERRFNDALATTIERSLREAGIGAFVVAGSGEPVAPDRRAHLAAQRGATLLVSVHHDSVQPRHLSRWRFAGKDQAYSDAFRGFSLFVSVKNAAFDRSVAAATAIADALLASGLTPTLHHAEPIPGEDRPLIDAARGVYRYDDLLILKRAPIPAVLLEAAVIVHRDEERVASTAEHRRTIARAVVAAATRNCSAR